MSGVLAERGDRHKAAVGRLEPRAPVRRGDVAHVGDRLRAEFRGRWEAPAHHGQHPLTFSGVDDGRHLVRKDAGQRRQVAGFVAIDREGAPDLVLGTGTAVEVAHDRDRSRSSPARLPSHMDGFEASGSLALDYEFL